MRGPSVDTDLRQAAALTEMVGKSVDEGFELLDGTVLLADLTNLTADRDRHAGGLKVANERGEFSAAFVVVPLLLFERWKRQVHESGRIDVDIAIARRDGFSDELLEPVDDASGVSGVL